MTERPRSSGAARRAGRSPRLWLRKGHDGLIRLVCNETEVPYERPPLSKGILAGDDVTYVAPAASYAERGIELGLGRSAVDVRRVGDSWQVVLDDGRSLLSDDVVLATGSTPRRLNIPGAHLGNVGSLSTLDHARRIEATAPDIATRRDRRRRLRGNGSRSSVAGPRGRGDHR